MATSFLLALSLILAEEVEGPPPALYSAKPMEGVVADGTTGEPLEGVIVVAQWVLHDPGKGSYLRLHVFETTTDTTGRYRIPGWGPKRNPYYPWTRLRDQDPKISFFKPGYRPAYAQNRWDRNEPARFSEWDGKTIKMGKFTGTDDEWARELSLLQGALAWGWGVVDWRSIPRMVLAVEMERLRFQHRPLRGSNISPLSDFNTTAEEVRRFLGGQK